MTDLLVIDCSAAVDMLIASDSTISLRRLHGYTLHAPHLIDYEFLSVLRRLAASGTLAPNIAREALDFWQKFEITRHPAGSGVERMWNLRHNISSYDAAYITLAEALAAPLLTVDKRLARAAVQYCDVVG